MTLLRLQGIRSRLTSLARRDGSWQRKVLLRLPILYSCECFTGSKGRSTRGLYYMYTQFFAFLMASFWGVFISASM